LRFDEEAIYRLQETGVDFLNSFLSTFMLIIPQTGLLFHLTPGDKPAKCLISIVNAIK